MEWPRGGIVKPRRGHTVSAFKLTTPGNHWGSRLSRNVFDMNVTF